MHYRSGLIRSCLMVRGSKLGLLLALFLPPMAGAYTVWPQPRNVTVGPGFFFLHPSLRFLAVGTDSEILQAALFRQANE
jgi:hypothetical protein